MSKCDINLYDNTNTLKNLLNIKNENELDLAETDDDAVGFYKKYGFTVADTKFEFDTGRYICVKK